MRASGRERPDPSPQEAKPQAPQRRGPKPHAPNPASRTSGLRPPHPPTRDMCRRPSVRSSQGVRSFSGATYSSLTWPEAAPSSAASICTPFHGDICSTMNVTPRAAPAHGPQIHAMPKARRHAKGMAGSEHWIIGCVDKLVAGGRAGWWRCGCKALTSARVWMPDKHAPLSPCDRRQAGGAPQSVRRGSTSLCPCRCPLPLFSCPPTTCKRPTGQATTQGAQPPSACHR